MSVPAPAYAYHCSGGAEPVVGGFEHRPVMLEEIVDLFAAVPDGVVLDATVGGGGHARALLEASPGRRLVGLDRDDEAVAAASAALACFGDRATVVKARFDNLAEVLDRLGTGPLAGALFDLGVSSPQLDRPERGFSYRSDAPLDMRMDRSQPITAARLIGSSTEEDLSRLFALHGEARFARRIAAAIIAARPVETTAALAEVVSSAVPAAARRRGHPAKRIFQALRAAVNSELEVLPVAVDAAIDHIAPRGRIVVISYHSGEDRAVKDRLLHAASGGCTCPQGLPCVCGAVPTVRLLNRGARKPSAPEIVTNPRSESARLRSAEVLPVEDRRYP
jgi:16S rRNA (cytosine1402-N4)-methyltransferase